MSAALAPESIHPALWRASQLARNTTRTVDTGYPALSAELPGGGWPTGTLVELRDNEMLRRNANAIYLQSHPIVGPLPRG